MGEKGNPFKLRGYHGEHLFCGREEEVKRLISHAENGVNTTLLSMRRMGKTGLIYHCFNQLNRSKNWRGIYVDIYATQNSAEFTNQLATAILKVFPQEVTIGKKFIQFLKGFSPVISYDAFTGMPEVSLSFATEQQQQHSLAGLLNFLEQQKMQTLIAIDEFQQIATYPEGNMEALLRSIIQQLKKCTFIFSGSRKHILLEMFTSAKRPFYSSTSVMHLDSIPTESYQTFIRRLFGESKKKIDSESIDFILTWTKHHTYYTQALCHKVFQLSNRVNIEVVKKACDQLLNEQEVVFFQYRNLLTKGQWALLTAIAREGQVLQPTGSKFISAHQLGNPASVRRSLEALVDKEMVIKEIDETGGGNYQVYDRFLSRWLAR